MKPDLNLRNVTGRVFMVGLEGASVTALERSWLRLIKPSGVILFRRNIESPEQVIDLLRETTAIIGRPLLRAVDLEGGLVDRLRDIFGSMPAPADVYGTRNPDLYHLHGILIGRAAHMMGFNASFAPVLDLALPESKDVMKSRVISARPSDVVHYASAFLTGLASQEVYGCGKHFPGLGGGTLDSHMQMPEIHRTWDQLWNQDLIPYRELKHLLPIVMVAHAAYPAVNHSRLPASISEYWISRILRNRIGYKGLVISDDMEMGGILSERDIGDAAIKAIAAGTDMIEICKDPALVITAFEAMLREAELSPSFARQLRFSHRRLEAWKDRYVLIQTQLLRNPNPARVDKLRAEIAHLREICS
ncbi:MAG: beta-N-acetylhexosaminidase [Acidobacteriaceae bacterium]